MRLYTEYDKQLDIYFEIVFKNKSLSKQNFSIKTVVSMFLIFRVFMFLKCFIQSLLYSVILFFIRNLVQI